MEVLINYLLKLIVLTPLRGRVQLLHNQQYFLLLSAAQPRPRRSSAEAEGGVGIRTTEAIDRLLAVGTYLILLGETNRLLVGQSEED